MDQSSSKNCSAVVKKTRTAQPNNTRGESRRILTCKILYFLAFLLFLWREPIFSHQIYITKLVYKKEKGEHGKMIIFVRFFGQGPFSSPNMKPKTQ